MQVKSKPTRLFSLFSLAEQRQVSVTELLTGEKLPLSNLEYSLILIYERAKARLSQEK